MQIGLKQLFIFFIDTLLKEMCSITHDGVLFVKCNLNRKTIAMLFTEDFWGWTKDTKQLILYIIKSVNYVEFPRVYNLLYLKFVL